MLTGQLNSTTNRIYAQRAATPAQKLNGEPAEQRVWSPAVDLFETPEAYHIYFDLPGVNPDAVDITFERATLMVAGHREPVWHAVSDAAWRVYAAERFQGDFLRAVRLPEHVDADRIEATFTDGVLTVTAPKIQTALPRRIPINGGVATSRNS